MTFSPPRCFRICAENRSSFEEEYISDSESKRETGIVVNSRFLPSERKKRRKKRKKKVAAISLVDRFTSTRSKIGVNARLVGQCQSTTSVHSQARFKVRKGG